MIEGLTVGRIVHVKHLQPDGSEECRAAIIVRVWSKENGCANLYIFPDGVNDSTHDVTQSPPIEWKTSVVYGDGPNHWHWPERESNT